MVSLVESKPQAFQSPFTKAREQALILRDRRALWPLIRCITDLHIISQGKIDEAFN